MRVQTGSSAGEPPVKIAMIGMSDVGSKFRQFVRGGEHSAKTQKAVARHDLTLAELAFDALMDVYLYLYVNKKVLK